MSDSSNMSAEVLGRALGIVLRFAFIGVATVVIALPVGALVLAYLIYQGRI